MYPIFDPTIAYILVMMSVFMVIVTFLLPGTGIPETVTVLLILAAWYVISHMVINTFALVITILSLVPLYFAYKQERFKKLYLIASGLMLVSGSVFLFVDQHGKPLVDVWVAILVSVLFIVFIYIFITRGIHILKSRSSLDPDTPVGHVGEARTDIDPKGSVYVHGELWSARSESPILQGEEVRVLRRDGFTLTVTKHTKDQ